MSAKLGELTLGVLGDVFAVDHDVTGRRRIEPGDQVEQRGLARTGTTNQGNELSLRDLQGHVADGPDLFSSDHEPA